MSPRPSVSDAGSDAAAGHGTTGPSWRGPARRDKVPQESKMTTHPFSSAIQAAGFTKTM